MLDGAKATGKTTLARRFAKSEVLLDEQEDLDTVLAVDPGSYLIGQCPRLIDEWQLAPMLWNKIRRNVDKEGSGRFILTGSAVPADDVTRHSGAGRIGRIRIRPMTLVEKGLSNGRVSLSRLFEGDGISKSGNEEFALNEIIECLCVGGWPGTLRLNIKQAQSYIKDYFEEIVRVDLPRMDGVNREPSRIKQTVRSVARNIATEASLKTITSDVSGSLGLSIKDETIRSYLDALERLMIIDNIPAWNPSLRSKSRIRQAPKHHFVDPSLAVTALGASPVQLKSDLNLLGLLFESLVAKDLRVFTEIEGSQIFHYRDNSGAEVDYVLESSNGAWAGIEVKLGRGMVEAGVKALHRLEKKVSANTPPAFLAVVVPGGVSYQREDGVFVLGLNSIEP